MRGSPIRTPSDQRSVGSSPRLIAASHVLHRLLVPRHPPCALNNLPTQQPSTQQTNNTNRPPTPHPHVRKREDLELGGHRLTRCSRPLCSSQTTTRHHPDTTPPNTTHETHASKQLVWNPERPGRDNNPHPTPLIGAAPHRSSPSSEPGDGARSLRTQQRAYDHHPTRPRSPPGKRAVLGAGTKPAAELVSVPPSSTTSGTGEPTTTVSHPRPERGSAPTDTVCR